MLWFRFALRYMFSPKSHSVINIIASVSVIAVVVPTAAMIILLAMFDGLSSTIDDLYSAVDGDIEVVAARGQTFAEDSIPLDELRRIDGVEAVAPYLEQSVMASAAGRRTTIKLRGIDKEYSDVVPIEEHVVNGSYNSLGDGDIILGGVVAAELGAYGIGTRIELYALNRKQISTVLPTGGISRTHSNLGGVVATNNDIDATLALYDLRLTQQLLNYADKLSTVAIRCREGADVERLCDEIAEVVGTEFEVRTRDQKNASMNAILRMERFAIVLIGSFIALVAAFSIVGAVVMLIADKQRDMLTLRALGGNRTLVRRIFVGEGMLLTTVGCIIGLLLGIGFALGQQHYGWIKIPGSMILESYPIELNIQSVVLVALLVIALGWIVTRLAVGVALRRNQKLN